MSETTNKAEHNARGNFSSDSLARKYNQHDITKKIQSRMQVALST